MTPERRVAHGGRRHDDRRETVAYLALGASLLACLIAGVFALGVIGSHATVADVEKVSKKNTEAIRVSCTLLANAIVESGGAASNGPQRQLNALYVAAIQRQMTSKERRIAATLIRRIPRPAGLTVPNCDQISNHPETVVALQATPPSELPVPSPNEGRGVR